jgi:dienelactone hydrolase
MTKKGVRNKWLSSLLFLLLATGGTAQATPVTDLSQGQTGLIEFNSITPTGIYPLITKAAAPPITITGTLTFPAGVSGKVPAMILAHHCGGITQSVTDLAVMLNQLGIATFVPDSFTPRGYPSGICTNTSVVSHAATTADILNALKLLATHPNIDSARIGIIGQSFGGLAVYDTAFEEVRKSIITNSLKFAAHIGLYPAGCTTRNWSANMTKAPMLMLLGGADDWTPAAECADFDKLLRAQGTPVTTIVYPGALHAWDSPAAVNYDANRSSVANCRFQFRFDTLQSSRYDTGEILSGAAVTDYTTACRTKGATQGRDDAAKAAATTDIANFLANTFKLTGVATSASQPDRIFNYAEVTYPALFAPAGTASQTAAGYYFRYYAQTNSYLGTNGGKLYYYAPDKSSSIVPVGDEAPFLNQASEAGY